MDTTQLVESSLFSEEQWWLPDFIQRHFDKPRVPPVKSSTLVHLDPNLRGKTVPEIRSLLHENGVSFLNGLKAFQPKAHIVNLQARIITLVQIPEPFLPFTLPDSAFILDGGGFFPFHAVLMAAYCSRVSFDIPPPREEDNILAPEPTFDIRIIRLPFGNAEVMGWFGEWLYRQDGSILHAILPSSPSLPPIPPFEALRQDPEQRGRLSWRLSSSFPEPELWGSLLNVLDFRRLMTMLGVRNAGIWRSLRLAWGILLDALNLSCVIRFAEDVSRGIDTSGVREVLKGGLGIFDNPPAHP